MYLSEHMGRYYHHFCFYVTLWMYGTSLILKDVGSF